MSAISGINQNNPSAPRANQSTDAFQSFTSGDFLKVMFAELTKQDPLQPNDSKALLDQIGTIRAIESDLALTDKLEEMAKQNQVTVGGSLLGKFAEGKTSSGVEVRGYVDSVSVTSQGLVLNLSSGFSVPMDRLGRVIDPALVQPGTTPPPPTTPPTTPPGTTPPEGGAVTPPGPKPRPNRPDLTPSPTPTLVPGGAL